MFCVFAITGRTMTDLDVILHGSAWMNKDIYTKHLQTYNIKKLQQIVIANKNAQNISFIQKIQSGKILRGQLVGVFFCNFLRRYHHAWFSFTNALHPSGV